jgi:hypothetical protein
MRSKRQHASCRPYISLVRTSTYIAGIRVRALLSYNTSRDPILTMFDVGNGERKGQTMGLIITTCALHMCDEYCPMAMSYMTLCMYSCLHLPYFSTEGMYS